jgi:hypothetical protein
MKPLLNIKNKKLIALIMTILFVIVSIGILTGVWVILDFLVITFTKKQIFIGLSILASCLIYMVFYSVIRD